MPVQRGAVIGAGTMGAEIAATIAERGIPVYLKDISQEFLDRGMSHIRTFVKGRIERGRITEDQGSALLANVTPILDYATMQDADFVIEAVPESMKLKKAVFADLDAAMKPSAILATNTSSLSIHEIATATKRPGQVVGFHFFNPATVMKLIEVVAADTTGNDTVNSAVEVAQAIGKLPVRVKECPGFLVNRILVAGMTEGLRYHDETGGDIRQIDAAITARTGLRMGPFRLADLVGLDVALEINKILENAYGERFAPPKVMATMVAEGRLGDKTGNGFYDKSREPAHGLPTNPVNTDEVADRFVAASVLEAYRCLTEGIATAEDIDTAMIAGAGWKVGPLTMAQQMGLPEVMKMLKRLEAEHGSRFAQPAGMG